MAHYQNTTSIPTIAAYYAIAFTKNHAFIDGNKRIALATCHAFLRLHQMHLTVKKDDIYNSIVNLSSGKMSEAEFIGWIEKHVETF